MAVPLFMVATVLALYALVRLSSFALVLSVLCFILSLILQKLGHKLEPVQPEPFKNGFDFVCRIFAEQWITFPRFVVTGGWLKNMSQPCPEKNGRSSTRT
jgi:hypothetical protein